jgi:hypothetical protein
MFKTIRSLFARKKTPKKKSLSPATKRANNIERKFKRLLKNGYSIPQARYWSKL